MNIDIRTFSDRELDTFQEEINNEVGRRAHLNRLIKNINELLYELSGTMAGCEYLSFTHNQLGDELFNTKDVDEPEEAPGWFAPELHIECVVK